MCARAYHINASPTIDQTKPNNLAYNFIDPFKHNGEAVDRGNGRRQIGRDGLDVNVQFPALRPFYDWNPHNRDQDEKQNEHPAET